MGESERLGLLINHLKTNAFNFSKQAKIAQGTVSSILKKKRRLSRDLIDQISLTYPNINIDWLLRGIGDMFHQELEQRTSPVATKDQAGHTNLSVTSLYYHPEEINQEYQNLSHDLVE